VIVGGVLAFPMTRSLAQQYATACMSLLGLSNSGTSLTFANAANRKTLPALTLADGTGRPVTLADLHGKVVLLTFWAANCPACDTEMTWFREFEKEYGGKRLVFLNHQVTAGADPIADSFGGLDPIPTTLLIDKSGRIAVTHGGPCTKDEFDTAIRALLNER
jgi:peroxiredoxin